MDEENVNEIIQILEAHTEHLLILTAKLAEVDKRLSALEHGPSDVIYKAEAYDKLKPHYDKLNEAVKVLQELREKEKKPDDWSMPVF